MNIETLIAVPWTPESVKVCPYCSTFYGQGNLTRYNFEASVSCRRQECKIKHMGRTNRVRALKERGLMEA